LLKENLGSLDQRAVPAVTKMDSIESPAFVRQVDVEEHAWTVLKQELAASAWIRTGFLLVRHAVRMLDVRGMDKYLVKTSFPNLVIRN
jgi:hypothetical protein